MEQKYQIENPNYSKIFIDYENNEEPVKFEVVSDKSYYSLTCSTLYHLWIFKGGFLIIAPTMLALMHLFAEFNIIPSLLMSVWILFPMIIALPLSRSKSFIKLIPFLNFDLFKSDHFLVKFEPHHVRNKQIEIPLFKNIGLDYKAEKEFSKYLKTFKIVPHEFNRMFDRKVRGNDKLWKAIWSFSEVPKTGELFVRFK